MSPASSRERCVVVVAISHCMRGLILDAANCRGILSDWRLEVPSGDSVASGWSGRWSGLDVWELEGECCCAQQTGMQISCGNTAYYYLFYLGNELILIDIRKPLSVEHLSRATAGPCLAEPSVTSTQLYLLRAGE
jgi:hypothetical protein